MLTLTQLKNSYDALSLPGRIGPLLVLGDADVSRQIVGKGGVLWKTDVRLWNPIDPTYVYMKCPLENLALLPTLNPHRIGTLLVVSDKLIDQITGKPGSLEKLVRCLKPEGCIILVSSPGVTPDTPSAVLEYTICRKRSGVVQLLGLRLSAGSSLPDVSYPALTPSGPGRCDCGSPVKYGNPDTGEVWCQKCENYRKESVQS